MVQTLLFTVNVHICKHLTCTPSLLLCLTSQACITSCHPKHTNPNSVNEVTLWTQCGSQGLGHACRVKQKFCLCGWPKGSIPNTNCPSNATRYHKEVSKCHLFILQNQHSPVGQCFKPYGVILEKAQSYWFSKQTTQFGATICRGIGNSIHSAHSRDHATRCVWHSTATWERCRVCCSGWSVTAHHRECRSRTHWAAVRVQGHLSSRCCRWGNLCLDHPMLTYQQGFHPH